MSNSPIIWDAVKLRRLADAISECQRGDEWNVLYSDEPENRFRTAKVTHEWQYVEAVAIYTEAKANLDVPERSYPPNNEGDEP